MFFEVGYTSLLPTAIKFEMQLYSQSFSSKKHILAFFDQQILWIEDNFSEKLLNFCSFNCTYLWRKIM